MRKGDSRFCFCFFSKRFRLQVRRAEREVSGLRGAPERQFSASATSTSWRVGGLEMNETSIKQADKNVKKCQRTHFNIFNSETEERRSSLWAMCRDRLCIRNDLLQPRLCLLLKTNPFLDVSFAAKGFFGQSDQEHPSAQIIEPGSGTGILMDLDWAQQTCKDAKSVH